MKQSKKFKQQILAAPSHPVKSYYFPNQSTAIQEAVAEKLTRIEKSRLALECEKLDQNFEQSLAEEGFSKFPAHSRSRL